MTRRLKQVGSGLLLVIAFCIAREMAMFRLDLPIKVTPSITSKGSAPSSAGAPGDFSCRVVAKENLVVTTGIEDMIKCPRSGKRELVVTLDGDLDDPFCFTPLYKSASISFHVTVREGGTTHVDYQFTVGLKVVGMVACRSFRRMLGREAGKAVDALLRFAR